MPSLATIGTITTPPTDQPTTSPTWRSEATGEHPGDDGHNTLETVVAHREVFEPLAPTYQIFTGEWGGVRHLLLG